MLRGPAPSAIRYTLIWPTIAVALIQQYKVNCSSRRRCSICCPQNKPQVENKEGYCAFFSREERNLTTLLDPSLLKTTIAANFDRQRSIIMLAVSEASRHNVSVSV